jgi:DNA invertase Pin-like site-specific DNA recombinase
MGRKPQLRIAGNGRKLRLIGDWETTPLEGLCESAGLARAVDKLQRHLVQQARETGNTWTEIGSSLGISRQAAWERFSAPPD